MAFCVRWKKTAGAAVLSVLALIGCRAGPDGGPPAVAKERPAPPVVTMDRLEPTPSVLEAPEGVKGDFRVASKAPAIDFGILPGQWKGAKLWSAWGNAVCASDGKFYVAIGDHDHPHGHTCVYAVDPIGKTIKQVLDVDKVLGRPADEYAPGKIHAPLIDAGDGWLYFVTYRGSVRSTTQELNYEGDWLLRCHLASGKSCRDCPRLTGCMGQYVLCL